MRVQSLNGYEEEYPIEPNCLKLSPFPRYNNEIMAKRTVTIFVHIVQYSRLS